MADFTLSHDGSKWRYEVPTATGIQRGWRPTQRWAKGAAQRYVPVPVISCPSCGTSIDELARRCWRCGTWVVGSDDHSVLAELPTPPTAGPSPAAPPTSLRAATQLIITPARLASDTPTGSAPPELDGPPITAAPLPRRPIRPPPPSNNDPSDRQPDPIDDRPPPPDPWRQITTRSSRRRAAIVVVPWVIGAIIISFLLFHRGPKAKPATAVTAATTTSSSAPESAAGKPCVLPVDPLPAGAPAVPVEAGPAPTKLVVKDLRRGTGATVTDTDSVTVNYVGVACASGKTFATSYPDGTVTVPLPEVIPGWAKGVAGMKVGGERLLGVPSNEAYGADGAPPSVAPDEPVWFIIEVTATAT